MPYSYMYKPILCILILFLSSGLASCAQASINGAQAQSSETSTEKRNPGTLLLPEWSDTDIRKSPDGSIVLNLSHSEDGYILTKYDGSSDLIQARITNPDGSIYPYPLTIGTEICLPLTGGAGNYDFSLLEHAYDSLYAVGLSEAFTLSQDPGNQPWLYPNQYVNYHKDSKAVALGKQLSDASTDDLSYIENVFQYVTTNITYDVEFAENVSVNYIPDPDRTLKKKTGICFDYASLMTAMLRSQGIPTKLNVGYAGTAYHAWISCWLKETGWVENIIYFDGKEWTLMDPTLAASETDKRKLKKFIGDGDNYIVQYAY